MAQKPTFVFTTGAWHGPESFNTHVAPALESKGYKCVVEQMRYVGPEVKPGDPIKLSIDHVSSIVEREVSGGRNVVMVCHSFGGGVGCSAVKGFTLKNPAGLKQGYGHVIGICMLSAFMVPARTALIDVTPPRAANLLFHYDDPDGFEKLKPTHPAEEVFYNNCTDEDKQTLPKLLQPLASSVFEGETAREGVWPGWSEVPTWYLKCTLDNAIPIDAQEHMIDGGLRAGADISSRTLETDHSPFYSMPIETIEFLDDAARAFVEQDAKVAGS